MALAAKPSRQLWATCEALFIFIRFPASGNCSIMCERRPRAQRQTDCEMIPGQDLCQTFVNAKTPPRLSRFSVGSQAFPLDLRAVKATASELKHCQHQLLLFSSWSWGPPESWLPAPGFWSERLSGNCLHLRLNLIFVIAWPLGLDLDWLAWPGWLGWLLMPWFTASPSSSQPVF